MGGLACRVFPKCRGPARWPLWVLPGRAGREVLGVMSCVSDTDSGRDLSCDKVQGTGWQGALSVASLSLPTAWISQD